MGAKSDPKRGSDPPPEIWDTIINMEKDIAVLKNDLGWVKQELQSLKKSWDRLKWAIIVALISFILGLIKMLV